VLFAFIFFPPAGGWVRPKRGCLFFLLAYYAFPRWYEFGERRWNDILTRENRRTRRETCPSATLSTTNPTWIDPGLRSKRPEANDLSHGMAFHFYSLTQSPVYSKKLEHNHQTGVKQLTLLLHIWEVPSSYLGPETSYSDSVFLVSLSPSKRMLGQ
jgi:hypothetical protein